MYPERALDLGNTGGNRANPSPTRPPDLCAIPVISLTAVPQQQRDWEIKARTHSSERARRTLDLMGKEDRGSPVLIFPSNPSASTATAPPQRQRDRCCEDAGENSLLKESFRLQSERNTQSVTWSTFALIGLDMSASSLSLPIFLRINFLISYLDSNRLTEHIRLTHTESFAEWQKAGAGCTSRAFKHPGHDVTAPDVWPSILTDYTYDSELDNADGVPLASRRSSMFPEGNTCYQKSSKRNRQGNYIITVAQGL